MINQHSHGARCELEASVQPRGPDLIMISILSWKGEAWRHKVMSLKPHSY